MTMILQSLDADLLVNMESLLDRSSPVHYENDSSILKEERKPSAVPNTPEEEPLDPNKSVSENKFGCLLPPNRYPLKLLLVFSSFDPAFDALKRAGEKLGFDTTCCTSNEVALDEFQFKYHDLIIIDTRFPKTLDYDTLCRSIKNTKGSQHTVLVSVVKKSHFEKDDVTIMSILETGFNRCLVETTNLITWVNELVQLRHSDVRPMAQLSTAQALYTALDKCKDAILVTDDICRIQFLNSSSEKLFGFRQDETFGRTIQEQLANDTMQITMMCTNLSKGRAWQGQIAFRRKALDPLSLSCKAMPVNCAGRSPTHFVIVVDVPVMDTINYIQSRGSINSIRKGSAEIRTMGNDFLRRTSLAKLNTLPLEAPITKIIGLISEAQSLANNNPQLIGLLDRVVEMLRCTELYSPSVKEEAKCRTEEPVASDLIGALLTQHVPTYTSNSRRSSNDSTIFRLSKSGGMKIKGPSSVLIEKLLQTSLTWEFNIFKLEAATERTPLLHLGLNLFAHFDVANTLCCEERTLYNWLILVESNYHKANAYHNSTHAADVMQAVAAFLMKDSLKDIMDGLDQATALIAACAHDIDHPGKSSAFLSNCDNYLAVLYNDVAVLESHHAALTFRLTLENDKHNIFKNLDRESYKIARHNVIDMILATEMTKHFEHLAKFVNVFCTKPSSETDCDFGKEFDRQQISQPENVTLVKRIMIKCADVSNPTRPMLICVEWGRRIAEEYFQQTDEEKRLGLPVVMPMFDRNTCSIPKSQIGFVDFIINDMIEAWNAFIDMPELVTSMRQNYIKWKEFDEQGFTTLSHIKKLQETLV